MNVIFGAVRERLSAGLLIAMVALGTIAWCAPAAAQTAPPRPAAAQQTTSPRPAAAQTTSPRPAPAVNAVATAERDRTSLIAALQKRFPGIPVDEWSHGGASFAPGISVTPLGGDNATNVNDILAIGKKAWERKFRNGKSLAACFPNGGQRVAATYPQVNAKTNAVVTLEMAINACLQLHGEPLFALDDSLSMGAVSGHLRSLSIGQKLNVRVSGAPALTQYAAGRSWFSRRIGDQDLACASCHVLQAGQVRVENGRSVGLSAAVGQVLAWPRVEPGGKVRMLHHQFQRCMDRTGAAPFELGSTEFGQLEYFLAAISSGLTLRAPITTR